MNFEDICGFFPKDEKSWPCPKPSRALSFRIRTHLRDMFGGIFAANDLNKRNSPTRMGVTSKPFENGDPISSLSLSHFVKTQELLTRIDYGIGRQRALVVFHNYKNMSYSSETSTINKGQLAMGIIAILEEAHNSMAHSFQVIAVKDDDLFAGCRLLKDHFRKADHVYFISDLLFDSSNLVASSLKAQEIITHFNLRKSVFLITRDPLEYPKEKENLDVEELVAWNREEEKVESHIFSGDEYFENSRNQILFLTNSLLSLGNLVKVVCAKDELVEFIAFIENDFLKKGSVK